MKQPVRFGDIAPALRIHAVDPGASAYLVIEEQPLKFVSGRWRLPTRIFERFVALSHESRAGFPVVTSQSPSRLGNPRRRMRASDCGNWTLARPAGLEPATSWFVASLQMMPIAADLGRSGPAAPLRGRSTPLLDACAGTRCNSLQALTITQPRAKCRKTVGDRRLRDTPTETKDPWSENRPN